MTYGPIQVFDIEINDLESIFRAEGFRDPGLLGAFQERKTGQKFGLIKPVNDKLEIHIRGYEDLTIDSEIELRRKYLQHLDAKSYPCYKQIIEILRRHNLRFKCIEPLPDDPEIKAIAVPKETTEWGPIVEEKIVSALAFLKVKDDKKIVKKLIEILSEGL